ncbi:MAK10-like protein [Tanacetum coccineum]
MAAHAERMERFENAIFKQREVINDRMTEMFGLLRELSASRTPKKVLIKEEARHPITKNVNFIFVIREEEEKDVVNNRAIIESIVEPSKSEEEEPPKKASVMNKVQRRADDEPTKSVRENVTKNEEEEATGASRVRVGKIKGKTYNFSPRGPVYEAILKKKITKKEDIGGNFEIPCNIGGLKHTNALVDQGSDVNVMPFFTYSKLTNERPAETDIRLSLASHSYIYPLGIAKDVLVDVAGYVYPVDFVILDIKEDEKRPFILGTPFLTMAKAVIKFDKGTITLRSGKSKISFHRIPESLCKVEKGIKNDIEPIAPTMTVNRLVLEWEEKIKLHQEKEMKFDQWRSKNFRNKHPALVEEKNKMDDEGEVTKFLIKNEEEISTVRRDGVGIKPNGVASPAIIVHTERGDGVAIIKRQRQDLHRDGVRDPVTALGRGRLKEDLEPSTWRWRHNFKATVSRRVVVGSRGGFSVSGGASRSTGRRAGRSGGASGSRGRGASGSGGASGSRGRGADEPEQTQDEPQQTHHEPMQTQDEDQVEQIQEQAEIDLNQVEQTQEQTQDQVHPQEQPQQAALRMPSARILQRKLGKQGSS